MDRQSRSRPVIYNQAVRQLLRDGGDPVDLEYALQDRPSDVRMTVPKIAVEVYDEIPEKVTVRYLPDEHALVVDLPDPEGSPDD